jgi:protease IV
MSNAEASQTNPSTDPLTIKILDTLVTEMRASRKDLSDRQRDLEKQMRSERRWKLAWQLLIFGGPVLSLILYLFFVSSSFGFQWGPVGTVVGVVRIDGAISPDGQSSARNIIPQLEKVFTYPNVKAVVLSIDSPGGAAVEAERIYGAMEAFKKKYPKPVVAVINNLGASAAYMIAMHTDKIYAARFSLVGSIGTIIEGWDAHRLLERFDISQRVYSSGPLKSMLSPFLPMSEEADKKARDLVQQAGKLFVDDLKQARGTRLRADIDYGTGEVWSGEQARAIGLVDEIGTLDEVVAKNFNVKAYDFSPSRQGFGALLSVFQAFSQVLNQNITTTLAPQIR